MKKKNTSAVNSRPPDDANRFVVRVGHSSEEQLTSKAYFEARTLKLIEQFSPQKSWTAVSRTGGNQDYPNLEDPTQLSRLFSGVFAYVATGLFVALDKKRTRADGVEFNRIDCFDVNKMILSHSGKVTLRFEEKISHFICTTIPSYLLRSDKSKKKVFRFCFVHPLWVMDSIDKGTLLPTHLYAIKAQEDINKFQPVFSANNRKLVDMPKMAATMSVPTNNRRPDLTDGTCHPSRDSGNTRSAIALSKREENMASPFKVPLPKSKRTVPDEVQKKTATAGPNENSKFVNSRNGVSVAPDATANVSHSTKEVESDFTLGNPDATLDDLMSAFDDIANQSSDGDDLNAFYAREEEISSGPNLEFPSLILDENDNEMIRQQESQDASEFMSRASLSLSDDDVAIELEASHHHHQQSIALITDPTVSPSNNSKQSAAISRPVIVMTNTFAPNPMTANCRMNMNDRLFSNLSGTKSLFSSSASGSASLSMNSDSGSISLTTEFDAMDNGKTVELLNEEENSIDIAEDVDEGNAIGFADDLGLACSPISFASFSFSPNLLDLDEDQSREDSPVKVSNNNNNYYIAKDPAIDEMKLSVSDQPVYAHAFAQMRKLPLFDRSKQNAHLFSEPRSKNDCESNPEKKVDGDFGMRIDSESESMSEANEYAILHFGEEIERQDESEFVEEMEEENLGDDDFDFDDHETPMGPEQSNIVQPASDDSSKQHSTFPVSHQYSDTTKPQRRGMLTSEENPNFIKDYFSSSRLHHLSKWKQDLIEYLKNAVKAVPSGSTSELSGSSSLISSSSDSPTGSSASLGAGERYFVYIDLDAFFVSASLLKYPHLKGKPVVVAHGGQTSTVASANYICRQFGIHNGTLVKYAKAQCPDLHVIPYHFDIYETISKQFYNVVMRKLCDARIEVISCDEAVIDVSGLGNVEKISRLVEEVRREVEEKTKCTCSAGIGGSILTARLALRLAKPNGLRVAPFSNDEVQTWLEQFDLQDLPGLGWSAMKKMKHSGVKSVTDLRAMSRDALIQLLGAQSGARLFRFARGIDDRELNQASEGGSEDGRPRQTIGVDLTYGVRFSNDANICRFILDVAKELVERMKGFQLKGKKVTLMAKKRYPGSKPSVKSLGHGHCLTYNRSANLSAHSDDANTIAATATKLYKQLQIEPLDLRGLGIHMSLLQAKSAPTMRQNLFSMSRNQSNASNITTTSNNDNHNVILAQANDSPFKMPHLPARQKARQPAVSDMTTALSTENASSLARNSETSRNNMNANGRDTKNANEKAREVIVVSSQLSVSDRLLLLPQQIERVNAREEKERGKVSKTKVHKPVIKIHQAGTLMDFWKGNGKTTNVGGAVVDSETAPAKKQKRYSMANDTLNPILLDTPPPKKRRVALHDVSLSTQVVALPQSGEQQHGSEEDDDDQVIAYAGDLELGDGGMDVERRKLMDEEERDKHAIVINSASPPPKPNVNISHALPIRSNNNNNNNKPALERCGAIENRMGLPMVEDVVTIRTKNGDGSVNAESNDKTNEPAIQIPLDLRGFREWMNADEPANGSLPVLLECLSRKVTELDLELVAMLLKELKKRTEHSPNWGVLYESVLREIQRTIFRVYRATLKL